VEIHSTVTANVEIIKVTSENLLLEVELAVSPSCIATAGAVVATTDVVTVVVAGGGTVRTTAAGKGVKEEGKPEIGASLHINTQVHDTGYGEFTHSSLQHKELSPTTKY
jgi:hypothetical protein